MASENVFERLYKNSKRSTCNLKTTATQNKVKSPAAKLGIVAGGMDENCSSNTTKKKPETNKSKWSLDDFDIGRRLGKGRFGSVYLAREKKSRFVLAIKILFRYLYDENSLHNQLKREIEIQYHLVHPNILPLFGYFYDEKRCYVMLEYAPKGDLYSDLRTFKRYDNERSASYIYQIGDALRYVHKKKVIHRDLKAENLLLGINYEIKIADFGWSVHSPGSRRQTFCGTLDYVAPEIIAGQFYNHSVDIWSLGVLAFELLCGKPPFCAQSETETMENIKLGSFCTPEYFCPEVNSFLQEIFQIDQEKRPSTEHILNHPWINKYAEKVLDKCTPAILAWKNLENASTDQN